MHFYIQNIYFKYQNQSKNNNTFKKKKKILKLLINFMFFTLGKIDCSLIIW